MRRVEDTPIDPEVAAALDAIDATLAGEAVDPAHAELAELALLLSAGRPQPDPAFAASLDEQVAWRFAADGPSAPRRRRTWWVLSPAWGAGVVAAAAAGVVAVVLATGGGGGHPLLDGKSGIPQSLYNARSTSSSGASASGASASGTSSSGASSASSAPYRAFVPAPKHGSVAALSSVGRPAVKQPPVLGSVVTSAAGAPTPPSSGRKIVQSAQLSLNAPPPRIDAVAQEVFNVVGSQNGYVRHSTVTASGGANAYAQFSLSVPSGNLAQTMSQLSQLKYASVVSRTDTTQDVNNQYVGDVRRLNDAKALRTALLKRLAQAVTTEQIDSLNQQIHDADQAISADQATVNNLNHQVDFTQIVVTINGALIAPKRHHGATGFSLGKATHDAGRVLTVAAGVALITLAGLVPVALLAALGWWVTTAIRRRRREQALDVA
jgi:hypothetical protein